MKKNEGHNGQKGIFQKVFINSAAICSFGRRSKRLPIHKWFSTRCTYFDLLHFIIVAFFHFAGLNSVNEADVIGIKQVEILTGNSTQKGATLAYCVPG